MGCLAISLICAFNNFGTESFATCSLRHTATNNAQLKRVSSTCSKTTAEHADVFSRPSSLAAITQCYYLVKNT